MARATACGSDADCPGEQLCETGECKDPAPSAEELARQQTLELEKQARIEQEKEAQRLQREKEAMARAAEEKARLERQRLEEEERRAAAARAQQQRVDAEALAERKRPWKLAGYASLAGAGASLIATTVFGALAFDQKFSLDGDDCVDRRCPATERATGHHDSMVADATLSTVFLVTTVALAGAGIYFLIHAGGLKPSSTTALTILPDGVRF